MALSELWKHHVFGARSSGRFPAAVLVEGVACFAAGRHACVYDFESKATEFVTSCVGSNQIDTIVASGPGQYVAMVENAGNNSILSLPDQVAQTAQVQAQAQASRAVSAAAAVAPCVSMISIVPAFKALESLREKAKGKYFTGSSTSRAADPSVSSKRQASSRSGAVVAGGKSRRAGASVAHALALASRGECARPSHGSKHLLLPFFRGRWQQLAFSSDGSFVAAYGEVTPEMRVAEGERRTREEEAAAEERLRSRGRASSSRDTGGRRPREERGKGKGGGAGGGGRKPSGVTHAARDRSRDTHRDSAAVEGRQGAEAGSSGGASWEEPGAVAAEGGASEEQVILARADRVIAVWHWVSGKLLGLGMPKQAVTQIRIEPFLGTYRGARPDTDDERGAGSHAAAQTNESTTESTLDGIHSHSQTRNAPRLHGHLPGTMEMSRKLCVTTSGTGHLRQWRLSEDRLLREAPVHQVSKRENDDYVDHAWIVTAKPDDGGADSLAEDTRGLASDGHHTSEIPVDLPVLVAATRRGILHVLAPRAAIAAEQPSSAAAKIPGSNAGAGHSTDSDGKMRRFDLVESFWAEFPALQSPVSAGVNAGTSLSSGGRFGGRSGRQGGSIEGGSEPFSVHAARGIVQLRCIEGWGKGFVIGGTFGYVGLYERCQAGLDESDGDLSDDDDGEELRRPGGAAGGNARGHGIQLGNRRMSAGHDGMSGTGVASDEPVSYQLLRAFLPSHQDVLDVIRERSEGSPGILVSRSIVGLDTGSSRLANDSVTEIMPSAGVGAGTSRIHRPEPGERMAVQSLATSPGDGTVLLGSDHRGLRTLSISLAESMDEREDPSKPLHDKGSHTGAISALDCGVFAPLVASVGVDCTLRLFDYLDSSCEVAHDLDTEAVSVAMHPSCYMVAAALPDRVRVFNVCATTRSMRPWRELTSVRHVGHVAFSPGGSLLAVCSGLNVQVFQAYDMKQRFQLAGHVGVVQSLAWSDDDAVLASVGEDGGVIGWDAGSGRRLDRMSNVTKGVRFDAVIITGKGHGRALIASGCGTSAPDVSMQSKSRRKKAKNQKSGSTSIWKDATADSAISAHRHSHELGLPVLQISKDGDTQMYRTGARLTALQRGGSDRALFAGTAGGALRAYPWPFPLSNTGLDSDEDSGVAMSLLSSKQHGQRAPGQGPDTSGALFRVGSGTADKSKGELRATPGTFEALNAGCIDAPPCTELQLHAGPVHSLRLSPDCKMLFSGGADGSVFVIAIPTAHENRSNALHLRAATRVPGQSSRVPRAMVSPGRDTQGSSDESSPVSTSASHSSALVQHSWEAPTARAFNYRVGLVERDSIREMFEKVHTLEEELSQSRAAAEDVLKLREREWADDRQQLLDDGRAEQRRLKDEYVKLQRESMEQAKRDEGIIADLKAHQERQMRAKQNEYEHRLAMEIDRFDRLDEQLSATKLEAEKEMQRMARDRAEGMDRLQEERSGTERKLRAEIDENRQKLMQARQKFETMLAQTEEEADEALRKERFFGERSLAGEQKRTAAKAGELASYQKEVDEKERSLYRAGELAEKAHDRILMLQEQIRQSREAMASKDRQREAAEDTVVQLRQENAALRSDNQTLQHHRSILEHNLDELKEEREPLAKKAAGLQTKLGLMHAELLTKFNEMKAEQVEAKKMEMRKDGLKAEVAGLRKKQLASEAKLRQIVLDIEFATLAGADGDSFGALRDIYSKHVDDDKTGRRRATKRTIAGSSAGDTGSKGVSKERVSGASELQVQSNDEEGSDTRTRSEDQSRAEALRAKATIGELQRQRDYMRRGARALARQANQTGIESERKSRAAMVDNSRLLSECNTLRREVSILQQGKHRLEEELFLVRQKAGLLRKGVGVGVGESRGASVGERGGRGRHGKASIGQGVGRPPRSMSPLGPVPSIMSEEAYGSAGALHAGAGAGAGEGKGGEGSALVFGGGSIGGLGSHSALEMGVGFGGSMSMMDEGLGSRVEGEGRGQKEIHDPSSLHEHGSSDSLAALARDVHARQSKKAGSGAQGSVSTLRAGGGSSTLGSLPGNKSMGMGMGRGMSQLSMGQSGSSGGAGAGLGAGSRNGDALSRSRVSVSGGRRSDTMGFLRSPMRGRAGLGASASANVLPRAGRGVVLGGLAGAGVGAGAGGRGSRGGGSGSGLLPSERETAVAVSGGKQLGSRALAGGALSVAGLERQLVETGEELALHNEEMAMLRGEASSAGAGED